jgi:hypothetical protein
MPTSSWNDTVTEKKKKKTIERPPVGFVAGPGAHVTIIVGNDINNDNVVAT